jgi:ATP-dependent helicase STH1/SNF2
MEQFCGWFNSPFEDDDDEGDNGKDHGSRKRKGRKKLDKKKDSVNDSNELTGEEKRLVVSSLHRVLKPFILRRLKKEVISELASKVERLVKCPLSGLQTFLYNNYRKVALKSSNYDKHKGKNDDTNYEYKGNLNYNNVLMQLRKICNHPYLVLESVKTIPDDLYYKYLVAASGKLCALDGILKTLLPKGHKVLIFSQMTTMLDILQGYLYHLGVACARIDGNTPGTEREEYLKAFNAPSYESNSSQEDTISVFLLSTRAGGVGINLQAADTVILYDSDWNPMADLQAISRAHRLGQKNTVHKCIHKCL